MNKNYHKGLAEYKISSFILKKIRGQMYKCFIDNFKIDKTLKIVDYGSSVQETEDSNFFIKCYPYKQNMTSLSIFDNKSILNYFPEITLKTIKKDEKLEFADNSFDILICNAVLEHFSSEEILINNVKEMSRISKNLFITIPNCYFPFEHHTSIPLLHYLPKKIFRFIIDKMGFKFYSKKENLSFYSKKSIKKILSKNLKEDLTYMYTGFKLGIFSSNLAIFKKYRKN